MKIFGSGRRQSQGQARQNKKKTSATPASKFQAVEVQFADGACEAVGAVAGTRYLCSKAPLLPLERCDRPERCACRYVRYTDRRQTPRRKSEGALPTESRPPTSEERRRDQGRRTEERGRSGERRAWLGETW